MPAVNIIGLETIPDVKPGQDLAELISRAVSEEDVELEDGDILVVSSKIVSKAENRVVDLNKIEPGKKARSIANKTGKDSRRVQVIMDEGHEIVGFLSLHKLAHHRELMKSYFGDERANEAFSANESVLFTKIPGGQLMTDGGTDFSNVEGEDNLSLLPRDPMISADDLREKLSQKWGVPLGIVISDSEIRALRQGTADIAIGYSGVIPMEHGFGEPDLYNQPTFGGVDSICDQLANGAALVMGQRDEKVPVVIYKGLSHLQQLNNEKQAQPALPYNLMASFMKDVVLSRFKLMFKL